MGSRLWQTRVYLACSLAPGFLLLKGPSWYLGPHKIKYQVVPDCSKQAL